MKKSLSLLFVIITAFVFAVNPALVWGQIEQSYPGAGVGSSQGISLDEQKMIAPDYYPRPNNPLPFAGQDHRYSVVMRGNGEAIVTLKVTLSNINGDNSSLRTTTLRLPDNIIPSDISVYQIIVQRNCMRYAQQPTPYSNTEVYNGGYYQPRCIQYAEPDYFNYYGGGKYQRAKFSYSGDTLTINLPSAIAPDKSGAFFVYFRAMGVNRKNLFGAYKYNFESLKVNDSINSLNIGISTDSDLYLKGAKGEVDYRFEDTSVMMKQESAGDTAMASPSIDRMVSQIGYGVINKNASNLAPLETYKVSGMYANSRVKLFGKEILAGLAVILIIAAVILLVARRLLRAVQPVPVPTARKSASSAPTGNKDDNARLFMISLGISFAASILLAGFTLVSLFISQNLNYIDYQMASLIRLAGMVFSFFVYAVVLFVPGIYYGYKKGFGWGIVTVVLTAGWMFVYFAAALTFVFLFGFNNYDGPISIMPMMDTFNTLR